MKKFLLGVQLFFIAVIIGLGLASMPGLTVLAAPTDKSPQELACKGSGGTWNDAKKECKEDSANGPQIKAAVATIVNLLLFLVGLLAVIVLVISGLRFVAANGEPQQVSKAKNNIIYAIIGIVVAFAAYAIVNFILSTI